ncbi:MAG TPA: hypothetical protein VHO29_05730 [Marmoricola sp.]|nr:hypothetical protein [Marmoricola sp.]
MSQVQRAPSRTWVETDVAQMLRALRSSGPVSLADLLDDPELDGWSARRLEHAVVMAWSDSLISIDPRDLLVAL